MLDTIIEEERAACERLLELSAIERTAIIANRVNELSKLVEEKERLACRLSRLESKRNQLIKGWTEELGVDSVGPKMERLLPVVGRELHEGLARKYDGLTLLARQVADSNRANGELLQDFLRVTQELLHCILGLEQSHCGYSSAGQRQGSTVANPASLNRQA